MSTHHPRGEAELSASRMILVLAVVCALFCGAVAVANVVAPNAPDARRVAVRCAWIAGIACVVAVICGLAQLRRTRGDAQQGANGPARLRIRFVVVGCIAGILLVGAIFAYFDRTADGVIF